MGVDKEEGSITFFPPSSESKEPSTTAPSPLTKEGKRGKDYYDRVKDVIDRVLECRNDEEKKIADLFKAEYNVEDQIKSKLSEGAEGNQLSSYSSRRRRRAATPASTASSVSSSPEETIVTKRDRPALSGTAIDLSWKDGGSLFPKRTSQVGDEFQATEIPPAGTCTKGDHSDL